MIGKVPLKQFNNLLLCGILICIVLYYGQAVLIPLCFSVFFAMLFTSMSNTLEGLGVRRIWTTLLSLLILVLVVAGIGLLVYVQSKKLAEEFPLIEKRSLEFIKKIEHYISVRLDVTEKRQEELIVEQVRSAGSSLQSIIKRLISGIAGILGSCVLIVVFTFLFLYQREKYESFFIQISANTDPAEAKRVIRKVATVARCYLTGRVLSILIFTVLFTIGFLIIGLKNAFLLAFIAAFLTIVPYIGSIVGGMFPFAVALVTEDSASVAVGALTVVLIIQMFDNYFIEPNIIGGEVNISGFFTILILFIGGLIWGVAGMVLFLPMLGVVKVVCDEIPALKPYGYLIGDQQKEKQSTRLWNKLKKLFWKREAFK